MSDLSLPLLRISIVLAMIFAASAGRASQLHLSSSAVSITATSSCAAEACNQEQLCRIADAAIDQIDKGSELQLGTLISATMLNPCVGRHFVARSAVR
jgi:hypothetical protein